MGLVNKAKLLLVAYKNTEDKKKIIQKVWKAFSRGGISGLKHTIISVSVRQKDSNTNDQDIYDYQQKLELPDLEASKSVTVIIEIKDPKTDITGTLNSLKSQSYQNYNILIIAPYDYTGGKEYTTFNYKSYPGEAYDKVLASIEDEYFIAIKGGNIFNPNALLLFAQKIEDTSRAIVYCDECIFDGNDGQRIRYFIKPEFSLIYELNCLYMEQGIMYSTEVIREAGGFLKEDISFPARIHDAALKSISYSNCILHISRILLLRNSFSEESNLDHNAYILNSALNRLGYNGNVLLKSNGCSYSLKYEEPRVSIIIPTDDIKLIQTCIKSILSETEYPVYDIIIVSNQTVCSDISEKYKTRNQISCVIYEESYNYSKKCNLGAQKAKGDILLFMQDTVRITNESWLKKIVTCFAFQKIGAVSPKILREDNTIRYAGIISGGFGFFPIPFNGMPNSLQAAVNEPAFYNREISILSATCLAVRKNIYESAGGFNDTDTPDKFSNVDFSFKVQSQGFHCLYCADSNVSVGNCNWYDSWFDTNRSSAYLYILKNYTKQLENDPYFTKEMKYFMLKNVPHDNAFFSGNSNKKSGKSVLLVSHELSLTGAPIALHYAAKSIRENGNYPVVLSPYDGKIRKELLSDGIDVIIDSTINGSDFWLKWASAFDLIIISTLVQYHSIEQLNDRNIPVIWWVHESRESYLVGADKLIPHEVGKNIHIYCGGGYAKAVMKEFRPAYQAEELLYCVPDYAALSNLEYNYELDNIKDKIVFSTIGTVEERKGQDIFAKAIMRMPKEYVEKCRFFIVGRKINDIIYDEVLRLKNMYPDAVTLINEVSRDEIRDVYNQCDAIVCASRDDPMPVFMTECLMLSKIAICSENTGTASLMKDGVNGFVYRNDDPNELMNKMMYVIDNIDDLDKVKSEGRKTYEKYFTKEAFDSSMTQLIAKLIKE